MFQLAKIHPRYQKYNPTNIDWIGDIPNEWKCVPLFTVSKENKQRNSGLVNENVLSLSYGKIIRRDVESNFWLLPESFETYQILEPGTIVLRLTDLQNDKRSIRVWIAQEYWIITSAYVWLNPNTNIFSDYLGLLLRFYDIEKVFYNLGGWVRQNIKFDELKKLPILLPEKPEQEAILHFLNKKNTLIDEAIAKKRQQIDFLSEHRTALINNAITKGLNPNVEMKNSGIEWIWNIPKGWEVRKIKYVADINLSSLPENTDPDYALKYIDISNVDVSGIISDPEEMYFQNTPSRARRIARQNDTIISTVRTYLKALAFLEISADNLIVSTGFAVLTPKEEKICPKYLYFSVLAEYFISKVEAQSTWVSYPAINASEIGVMSIVFPTIAEQKRIVEHLEKEIAYIEAMKEKIEQSIELLQEYKTSLISHVVSGKIKVS